VQYALDILSSLEFEGPVLATIAQKQELMDGSGYPQGLSGEAILLTARILAVANAFVALVSPRAYRDEVPIRRHWINYSQNRKTNMTATWWRHCSTSPKTVPI